MTQIKIHARPISGNVEGKIEGAMHSAPAKSSGIWKGGIRVKPINKPCDHLIVTQNTFYSRAAHITCEESGAELRTQADPRCEPQNPSYSYTEQHGAPNHSMQSALAPSVSTSELSPQIEHMAMLNDGRETKTKHTGVRSFHARATSLSGVHGGRRRGDRKNKDKLP